MLDCAHILTERLGQVKFIISHAPSVERERIQAVIEGHLLRAKVDVISDGVEKVFERCDAIVAASGSVTLQAAIYGIPMVIIYKVSPVSAWLGKALIRVPNVGLVNLVAGRELVPELLQENATGVNIAQAIQNMLQDEEEFNHLKHQLLALRDMLGGGASERVADLALEMLNR